MIDQAMNLMPTSHQRSEYLYQHQLVGIKIFISCTVDILIKDKITSNIFWQRCLETSDSDLDGAVEIVKTKNVGAEVEDVIYNIGLAMGEKGGQRYPMIPHGSRSNDPTIILQR